MAQEHDRTSSDHLRYRRSLERRRGTCVKVEPSAVATAHCSYFGIMLVGDDRTAGAVERSSTPRLVAMHPARPLFPHLVGGVLCDGRTSSANGAFGRHDSAGARLVIAASRRVQHPCGPDVVKIEEFSNPKNPPAACRHTAPFLCSYMV